jgi:hypothetical protein
LTDSLIGYFVVAASTSLGLFILACGLDIIVGMGLAWRQGKFDPRKLPQFLDSQFATKQFLGVLGLGAAAAGTAFAASLVNGGLTQDALEGVAQAALGAMTVGAAAMMASVIADTKSKVGEFLGFPPSEPLPAPAPIPVEIVESTPTAAVGPAPK